MTLVLSGNTGSALDGIKNSLMFLETAKATTSGTSIDFTGIPSWAKKITIILNGVSTNSTGTLLIQIGSASVVTSGYASALTSGVTTTTVTNGFAADANRGAASLSNGSVILKTLGSNIWVETGLVSNPLATVSISTGTLTLGGILDRIRLTTASGTDTFDAGSINILIEGYV